MSYTLKLSPGLQFNKIGDKFYLQAQMAFPFLFSQSAFVPHGFSLQGLSKHLPPACGSPNHPLGQRQIALFPD